jgi:hypothetical protein
LTAFTWSAYPLFMRKPRSPIKENKAGSASLPAMMRPLFWEYNFRSLSWEKDRNLVVSRILSSGAWQTVCWLRTRMGDADLAQWIIRRRGRGLSAKQLRFWELVLDLPHDEVDVWLVNGDQTYWQRSGER